MVNSKLLPALTITSCASLCLRLYISVLLTLITASPAFKPAASAGDPVLTCNARCLLNKRISYFSLKMIIPTNQWSIRGPFSRDTQTLSSVEETFGRLEPLYLSACVTPRMSDTVHPFTRGRSKKEGFAENTSRNVEDKPGGALLKSKNTFFARSKTLLLFISCCSLIVHEA